MDSNDADLREAIATIRELTAAVRLLKQELTEQMNLCERMGQRMQELQEENATLLRRPDEEGIR